MRRSHKWSEPVCYRASISIRAIVNKIVCMMAAGKERGVKTLLDKKMHFLNCCKCTLFKARGGGAIGCWSIHGITSSHKHFVHIISP